jgi:hypothetical protein
MTAWAAKCSACWDDPHCRSMVVPGISSGRGQPAGAGNIARLGADGVHAAKEDVLDRKGIDVVARHQGFEDVGPEVGRVDGREAASPPADRRANGVDDESLGHRNHPTF